MSKIPTLRSVFGFDKSAVDLADNLSGSWSRENVQKILGGLKTRNIFYRGPRRLMNIAQRVFSRPLTDRKIDGHKPYVD